MDSKSLTSQKRRAEANKQATTTLQHCFTFCKGFWKPIFHLTTKTQLLKNTYAFILVHLNKTVEQFKYGTQNRRNITKKNKSRQLREDGVKVSGMSTKKSRKET